MKVIILAAGAGSRLKRAIPKPLAPIAGGCMIDLIIKACKKANLDDISVVLGNHKEQMFNYLSANLPEINIYYQNMSLKGSAAALFDIDFDINEDYLILNADMPLVTAGLLSKLADNEADIALSAFYANDAGSYGRVIMQNERFIKIVEAKDANKDELSCKLCNGGLYKISGKVLKDHLKSINNQNASGEFYLTDLCAIALENAFKIDCVYADELELLGVNDLADLARAQELINERICNEFRRAGHIIEPNVKIEYEVALIGQCTIACASVIKGKSVLEDANILENTIIEDSHIKNSSIGPMARIRPKCDIADSKIGNFVECKAALLNGVKAGHLAYLGDCSIESGTNIGCGVIVCNYDGEKKYKSHIGKDCFIGSNVNLISPLNVPDGSYIAAGSSLSAKDCELLNDKEIFIARSKGVMIKKN